jgi:hypothetical protein
MRKTILFILLFLGVMILSYFIVTTISENALRKQVSGEISEMFNNVKDVHKGIVTEADIKNLPEPVKRWLRYSEVIGKEKVVSIRLKQNGFFRMKIDGAWMPFEAEEYFTVDEPAFIWQAKMKMAPFFYATGRDRYYNGKGNMLFKLASIVTVADGKGYAIDQGTLLRFLNEIMWFPSAALSYYINWEAVDKNSAKATMTWGDVTSSATYLFDEKGALVTMTADRYRDVGEGKFKMDKWATPIDSYKRINKILIPYKGSGVWKLKSGDFEYIKLEITDIEYNTTSIYEE